MKLGQCSSRYNRTVRNMPLNHLSSWQSQFSLLHLICRSCLQRQNIVRSHMGLPCLTFISPSVLFLWSHAVVQSKASIMLSDWTDAPPHLSIWPHLFRGAGHEKRRGEQLKWSLAFSLYIGSFPCAQLPGPVHTAQLGPVCFVYLSSVCILSIHLCFFDLFVSPSF